MWFYQVYLDRDLSAHEEVIEAIVQYFDTVLQYINTYNISSIPPSVVGIHVPLLRAT